MFKNASNLLIQIKFKKKNLNRLLYLGLFILWLVGYIMIKKIEMNNSEANVYFTFGFIFAGISLATAFFIPNDRDKTLKFFKVGLSGYALFIILFEILIMASNKGGDGGSTAQVIRTVCTFSKILIPLGLILWQAKKWTFLTGIRKNKRDAIKDIKNNGNNGMN